MIFNLIVESNAEVMYLPLFVCMIILCITLVIERKWFFELAIDLDLL